jgi:hypothetical protein
VFKWTIAAETAEFRDVLWEVPEIKVGLYNNGKARVMSQYSMISMPVLSFSKRRRVTPRAAMGVVVVELAAMQGSADAVHRAGRGSSAETEEDDGRSSRD